MSLFQGCNYRWRGGAYFPIRERKITCKEQKNQDKGGRQDLVISVKLRLGLIHGPLTLDTYPLSLVHFPKPLFLIPYYCSFQEI